MEKEFFTMDDFNFSGKTAIIRVDINCPFNEQTKQIEDSERISAHAQTIKELSEKGAKVVVLAHQGRKGDPDFIPLQQHALLLSKHMGKNVNYVNDLFGENALNAIKQAQNNGILLLENTRFFDDETKKLEKPEGYSKTDMIKKLASICDYFVLDGFSVSHRAQASVVGLAYLKPACAGRVMQKELSGLANALDRAEHPNIYVLGGAKPEDVYLLLKYACSSPAIDNVLTSGILGELCAIASGADLGSPKSQYLKEKGFDTIIPELASLLEQHSSKIEIPLDVAIEENGKRKEYAINEIAEKAPNSQSSDIGQRTISRYAQIISSAKTIYFKGPVGVYENPLFENGTKAILRAIESSNAFKLMGGGHSVSAVEKFSIDKSRISHISLAGGAVVEYLQGKKNPGLEALKYSYNTFKVQI
ncbi:MAG: phosphoglycerate kinase [Candidatus Micrarchaeota archaeon]